MNNKVITIFLSISSFLFAFSAQAICPVCTFAVGAGVGFSRYLGIDDTISGVWIGGLTVSMIMWTINWLNKKNIRFQGMEIFTSLAYFGLIIIPLYFMKDIWHPLNTLWGINKLLLGIILGGICFFAGARWYDYLKNKNGDKAYFPFQKVAMPVGMLLIFSLIFYFLTR